MVARRSKSNRAQKERRRRARQHLMAAGRVLEAQHKVQRGSSKKQKQRVRHRFARNVQRAQQRRRRRQVVNRRIWEELRVTTQKSKDAETLIVQPAMEQKGQASDHHTGGQHSMKIASNQHWVAVGSSTTDCAPSVGRKEDDGILFRVEMQLCGRSYVALVDLGASRCYASPDVVEWLEQPCTPKLVHLELVDGLKIRSTQKVQDV